MRRGSGELSSRRRRRKSYDRERERERESWRKGVYRYSINMKYKQAEEGREGIRSVWWFGFAFPFGHQGDRTPTRQPAPERNETSIGRGNTSLPPLSSSFCSSSHRTAGFFHCPPPPLSRVSRREEREASRSYRRSLLRFALIRDDGREGMRGRGKVNDCEFFKEPSRFKFLRLS